MEPLGLGPTVIDGTPLTVDSISRRNWSTVAVAEDHRGERVFLKQFRDATGQWRPYDLDHERHGTELLASAGLDSVEVEPPVLVDRDRGVLGYRWQPVVTLDEAIRSGHRQLPSIVSDLGATAPRLLGALEAMADGLEAKRRHRPWAAGQLIACPKGLDYRNLGWRPRDRVLMFDPGPVQLAPIEEAAAKLICSALLLNFGRPLRRCVRGVDLDVAAPLTQPLLRFTNRSALDYELDRLLRHRLQEPKPRSVAERIAAGPATRVVGKRYWASMQRWIDAQPLPAANHEPKPLPISETP